MAKSKNVKNKSRKKAESKKIDEVTMNNSNEVYTLLKILFGVLVVLGAFYLITILATGKDIKKEKVEAAIQYEEILAGTSFTQREDEYIVVYYDFSDTSMSSVSSAITDYSVNGSKTIYTVDMSAGFNQKFKGTKANENPESVDELSIAETTLIVFKDGKVVKYIEGSDEVISNLK